VWLGTIAEDSNYIDNMFEEIRRGALIHKGV